MSNKSESSRGRKVTMVGEIIAVLCFMHCIIFITASVLIGFRILILPPHLLYMFDNAWAHGALAIIAITLGIADLTCSRGNKKSKKIAVFLLFLGFGIMSSSILFELIIHDATYGIKHEQSSYVHALTHILFILGHLSILGSHRVCHHH